MKVKVPVYDCTTFHNFRCRLRLSFADEIGTTIFRIYKFRHNFSDINEREIIDDSAKFDACIEMLKNPDSFPPVLYVWDYEGESPTRLPTKVAQADGDRSSVVSRDSNVSKICKPA